MSGCISYIFSFFLIFAANYHPVHVSVLNVDVVQGKPTINLSFKVFTGDLELAIAHNYNVALNLGKANENPASTAQIQKYMSAVFSILINNHNHPQLSLTKKEINEDAVWLHFSIPAEKKINELNIKNELLMDIYEDETNLVIVSVNGKELGYRMNYTNREIKIKM